MLVLYTFLALLTPVLSLPGITETVAGGGLPHQGKKSECNDIENSRDGLGTDARFNYPWGVAYDHNRHVVYVADCGCMDSEHRTDKLRMIDLHTRAVTTLAGSTQGFNDGFGKDAHFTHIAGITMDPLHEMLYIADSGNHRIRVLYLANNRVETIAGMPIAGFVDQSTVSSQFNNPQGVAVLYEEGGKRRVYVADTDNHAIRTVHLTTDFSGQVKTLAGGNKGFKDGYKVNAQFYHPTDIVVDGVGNFLYVADHFNHAIRKIEVSTGLVSTLAGQGFGAEVNLDKQPVHVTFHYPEGLVFDPDYNLLYVCEFENHSVRVVTVDNDHCVVELSYEFSGVCLVKTLAGESKGKEDGIGRMAQFFHPSGMAFDRKNKMLYVSDQYNHLVRTVTAVGSKEKYVQKKPTEKVRVEKKQVRMVSMSTGSSWTLNLFVCVCSVVFGVFFARPCFHKLKKLLRI